jgi:hypothetical protein
MFATLLLAGCALVSEQGSGTIVTEPRDVSGITAISLSGSGKLRVEQGTTEALTITADDNLLPLLTSEVRDGRLHLGVKPNTSIRPSKTIVYNVKVKSLDGVDLSGSGDIDLKDLDGKQLEVKVSGSGSLTAAGKVEKLGVRITGSGKSRTEGLACKSAAITISGSGNVVVAANEELDVKISGSGSVQYVGDPKVTKRISGSGSVRQQK